MILTEYMKNLYYLKDMHDIYIWIGVSKIRSAKASYHYT